MLIKLFRFLFGGCDHKYKIIRQTGLTDGYGNKGVRYILQCEKCGKIKRKDCI